MKIEFGVLEKFVISVIIAAVCAITAGQLFGWPVIWQQAAVGVVSLVVVFSALTM